MSSRTTTRAPRGRASTSRYQDPKLDDLLVQGQSASDLDARKAVYKQLQAYTSETLPYLFLWYPAGDRRD